MAFKSQCDIVKENPSGMAKLPSPHNFSSNPGWIEKAKEYAQGVAKDLSQRVEKVKEAYRTGNQETESLGKELGAKQEMVDQARIALKPTSDQSPPQDSK
jgi:hypothetical protein